MSPEIAIVDRQRGHRVDRRGLSRFLAAVAREVPPPHDEPFGLCLVGERRMRELNRRWRGKPEPTDVLSFGSGSALPGAEPWLGDIVISVPTAARQARRSGHSLARELAVLALHGYLHLLGYDHETDDGTMHRLQRRLERRFL